ncbi:uncharacterized protein LOC135102537 [Scylla paramamosain]|uniref:uncharacterized protein LOC135102537 n=1 Tax=Scylla paramamosain TaxID=85552 RepID=UPI003083416C
MGHCSASNEYTRRYDETIKDIPRKFKYVDDTLLCATSVEEVFWHAYTFLETCSRAGITLKPKKIAFCKREIDFVGFFLDWDSYQPAVERLSAIRALSMPDRPSIKDIRSWFGLVNQLAPFLATAPLMEPFRNLLKKKQLAGLCIGMISRKESSIKRRRLFESYPEMALYTMVSVGQQLW